MEDDSLSRGENGARAHDAQTTSPFTLTLEEEQYTCLFQGLLKFSGTTDSYWLELWMITHYEEIRAECFRELLKGSSSAFS
jgi:hypothetical protein